MSQVSENLAKCRTLSRGTKNPSFENEIGKTRSHLRVLLEEKISCRSPCWCKSLWDCLTTEKPPRSILTVLSKHNGKQSFQFCNENTTSNFFALYCTRISDFLPGVKFTNILCTTFEPVALRSFFGHTAYSTRNTS